MRKIDKSNYYKDYPYYHGIAVKTPEGYELIDGHHRCSENKDKKLSILYFSHE